MSEFEEGRMRAIMDLFHYHNKMTMEDIIMVHVPSATFPNKTAVEMALNRCIAMGKLVINKQGVYSKIGV